MCFKMTSESLAFRVADQEAAARVEGKCLLSRCVGITDSDAPAEQ